MKRRQAPDVEAWRIDRLLARIDERRGRLLNPTAAGSSIVGHSIQEGDGASARQCEDLVLLQAQRTALLACRSVLSRRWLAPEARDHTLWLLHQLAAEPSLADDRATTT